MPTPYEPPPREVAAVVPDLIAALERISQDTKLNETQMRRLAANTLKLLPNSEPSAKVITPLQQQILDCLAVEPMTTLQLAEELGRSGSSVKSSVDILYNGRHIYVRDWPYNGDGCKQRAREWAVKQSNTHVDAPKPPPMSNYEKKTRYRANNRARLRAKQSQNLFDQLRMRTA